MYNKISKVHIDKIKNKFHKKEHVAKKATKHHTMFKDTMDEGFFDINFGNEEISEDI